MRSFFPAAKGLPYLSHPVSTEVLIVMRNLLESRRELLKLKKVSPLNELGEKALEEVNNKLNFLGDNYKWFKKLI